jgi:hypothetical protein
VNEPTTTITLTNVRGNVCSNEFLNTSTTIAKEKNTRGKGKVKIIITCT